MNSVFLSLIIFHLMFLTIGQRQDCRNLLERFEWQKHIIPRKDGENYYWKSTPPQKDDSIPVEVSVMVMPTAIRKISLSEQTIEVQYNLLVFWDDCRLDIPPIHNKMRFLASEISRDLWVPTFEYRNCIGKEPIVFDERIHTIIIVPNVTLGYFSRRVVNLHCSYDLSGYPMDTQHCKLQIQLGTPDNITILKILPNLEELTKAKEEIIPPQYQLNEIQMRKCPDRFASSVDFSCVELYITFSRQMTFHMGVTFLPSILIVILTWISFWMDADASAPRVTLGLTSMLTLVTTYVNAQKDLPAVSYLKAIDVYMFACIFLVFASLVEFCIANYLSRIAKGTVPHKILSVASNVIKPGEKEEPRPQQKPSLQKIVYVSPVDKYSRIIFPVFFIVFNIVYWSYFLH